MRARVRARQVQAKITERFLDRLDLGNSELNASCDDGSDLETSIHGPPHGAARVPKLSSSIHLAQSTRSSVHGAGSLSGLTQRVEASDNSEQGLAGHSAEHGPAHTAAPASAAAGTDVWRRQLEAERMRWDAEREQLETCVECMRRTVMELTERQPSEAALTVAAEARQRAELEASSLRHQVAELQRQLHHDEAHTADEEAQVAALRACIATMEAERDRLNHARLEETDTLQHAAMQARAGRLVSFSPAAPPSRRLLSATCQLVCLSCRREPNARRCARSSTVRPRAGSSLRPS